LVVVVVVVVVVAGISNFGMGTHTHTQPWREEIYPAARFYFILDSPTYPSLHAWVWIISRMEKEESKGGENAKGYLMNEF
jgi:hypothetical protein